MASLKENALTKLSTTTSVDMQTGTVTLYTVPTGKTMIPVMLAVRNNSASLAGGTAYSFTGWRQAVDLSGMTAVGTICRILYATDNTDYTVTAAGAAFQMAATAGASGTCTAAIDLWGYLV